MLSTVITGTILSLLAPDYVNALDIGPIPIPIPLPPNPIPDIPSIPDPEDLFEDALDALEEIISKIPDIPILGDLILFTKCAAESGNSAFDATPVVISDATIIIKDKITMIKECKNAIIGPVGKILSDNDKDAYLDLAKGFFDKCSGLNAGAITIEQGMGGAIVFSGSAAIGLAIDTQKGDIYTYTAACWGVASDITVDGGITFSLFNQWSDVAGCSKYYTAGFDVNVLGVEGGMDALIVIGVPSDEIIARGIGFGVGLGGNPMNVESGYCYTFTPIHMVNVNDFKDTDIIDAIPSSKLIYSYNDGRLNGNCLTMQENNIYPVMYPCTQWSDLQQWYYMESTKEIRNKQYPDKCYDLNWKIMDCDGGDTQKFTVDTTVNELGCYYIYYQTHRLSMCMQV